MNAQGSKLRNSNIELLRIVLAVGVVFLHLNYSGSSGLLQLSEVIGAKRIFSNITEIMFACAVDTFLIISGYFLAEKYTARTIKAVELLVEVAFFSAVFYIIGIVLQWESFSLTGLLKNIIPHNYYITFYVCIMLIAPFISRLCNSLDSNSIKQLLMIVIGVAVIWSFTASALGVVIGGHISGLSPIALEGDGGVTRLLTS